MDSGTKAELQAIKELIAKVVGSEGEGLAQEEGGAEDLLDPSSLEEVLEGEAGAEAPPEVATAPESEMGAELGEGEEPFDPSMVSEFFGKKPGEGRKPVRSQKFGGGGGDEPAAPKFLAKKDEKKNAAKRA